MAYCAVADVLGVLNPTGGMTTAASAAALPAPIISGLIGEAEDFVNGWLAARYSMVPFPDGNVPDLVLNLTKVVAAFYCVTAAAADQQIPTTHPALIRYTTAVATLRALAAGTMTLALPGSDGANPQLDTQPITGAAFNITGSPCFTPGDYLLGPVPCGAPYEGASGWQGLPL